MTSDYPNALDDLNAAGLEHGDVSDALAAVQATLGVNPQGGSATVAARLAGGGRLLSGNRAPLSGSGLLPLDGVNDPWRWFGPMVGWVGPAYEVTWQAGDQVGFLPPISETNEEYALWIGSVTTPTEANDNPGDFYGSQIDGTVTTIPVSNIYAGQPAANANGPGIAITDGSGIAFLFQAERGWTGPTAVPDPTWTADLANLTAVLGSDVVIGDPFPWNEVGEGADGDFWLNTTTLDLYGPKAGGVWPAPKNVKGFDANAFHQLHNSTWFGPPPADIPDAPSIVVVGGPEIDPSYLDNSTVAWWYEDTAGAPVVHFKAKDSTGAVYVASLPMTLA